MSDSKEVSVEQNNQGGGNQQNEGQNNDKVLKQHEQIMEKLAAVLGGKEKIFPSKKVGKDVLASITEGLLKDRKEAAEKELKAGLIELIDKKVTLDRELKAKQEELKKLEINKTKEFNEAATKLFNKIDGIEQLASDYRSTLASIKPEPKS